MNRSHIQHVVWHESHNLVGEAIPEEYDPRTTLDELGFDSLDRVQLLMILEAAFGIEVRDAEWELVETVEDAVDLVRRGISDG